MQKGCNVFWKSKHWKSLIEVSEATLHNHTIILFERREEWPFSLNQWALKFPLRALEMSHLKGKLLLGFFQRETFADGSPGHAMNALHIVAWCLCHSSSPVEVEHGWTKHSSLPSFKARGLQICLQTSFQFILQDISNAFSCSFCLAPKTQHYRITSRSVPVPTSTLQPSAAPCRPPASASTSCAGQDPAGTTWSKASYLCLLTLWYCSHLCLCMLFLSSSNQMHTDIVMCLIFTETPSNSTIFWLN